MASLWFSIRRISTPLLSCLILAGQFDGGRAGNVAQKQVDYVVAGVALGMDFENVRQIHPAIKAPKVASRDIRLGFERGVLTLTFGSQRFGGKLTRIKLNRPVDPTTTQARRLLEHFVSRYGPYDRILYRRKMEPAGRIIGFEWKILDKSSLRVILRKDPDYKGLRLSILARML